jgi:hypothetical protein
MTPTEPPFPERSQTFPIIRSSPYGKTATDPRLFTFAALRDPDVLWIRALSF